MAELPAKLMAMNDLSDTRDRLKRYGVALASGGLALLIRGALPIPSGLSIYSLAVAAVVVSGWYGGRGPGWVSLLVCATGILYWFIPPADSFSLPSDFALGFYVFVALGLLLTEFSAGRRRAVSALAESERRFRLMAETVPGFLWIESIRPRRMLYASPMYEELWGLPTLDLERDPDAWIAGVHAEDRELVSSVYRRWVAGDGGDRLDLAFRIVRSDGRTRSIQSRGTLIRDEHGTPVRAAGVAADVSEAKRAEEEVAKLQAEVAHVTRVASMGELAATIAHEVNQPLAAITMSGGALARYLARESPDLGKARDAAAAILKEATRAAEVIAKVRAFIRKTPSRTEWVDVNEAIAEVVALTRGEAQKRRVALQTRLSSDVPPVRGDRIQVQQVLLNLIINGIEAASGAGDGPRDLIVGSAKDGSNDVVVTVQDSGAGVDPAVADRLFEAFYTTKPAGMGMGLAICRSIVESHGGRIWATANAPRGAVFHFTLPAGSPSQDARQR